MSKDELTQDELHALLVLAERSVDLSMPNGTPAQQEKFLNIWYFYLSLSPPLHSHNNITG